MEKEENDAKFSRDIVEVGALLVSLLSKESNRVQLGGLAMALGRISERADMDLEEFITYVRKSYKASSDSRYLGKNQKPGQA